MPPKMPADAEAAADRLPASVRVFIVLPPDAASLNALLKTAFVELSACSLYRWNSSAVIDSCSRTLRVSRSSEIAMRCCSPGASGSE